MNDGKLLSGQVLYPEQTLISVGGHAHLHNQSDGNLVSYLDNVAFWASQTAGHSAGKLHMDPNGNLVLYGADGPYASTRTDGHPGAMVQLQDDGNFVIYEDPNGPHAGHPIWASSTLPFVIGECVVSPPDELLPPLAGDVTLIDGGRGGMQDANGRRLSVNIHAGDFLAKAINKANGQTEILADLDYLRSVGSHALRIWFFLPSQWWATPPRPGNANPNDSRWEPAVRWLLQALKDRGLYLQYDGGDIFQFDQTGRVHWAERIGQLIAESGVGLFSAGMGNEAWQNGESYDANPASVQRMVDVLHAFERGLGRRVGLSTLTSVRDEGLLNDYVRGTDAPTVISYHNDRGPTAPRHSTERAWTAAYAQSANATEPVMRAYKLDDEPAGVNSQDGPVGFGPGTHVSSTNPSDMAVWRNLEAFGIYAAAHYVGRQSFTVLASCGVVSDEPFSTYPHFAHAAKIAKLIGGEAQGWKQFHGGDGRDFSHLRIVGVDAENKVRCDHALNEQTGEVRVCIYAVAPGTFRLPVISTFQGVIVTPDASLEQHPFNLHKDGSAIDVSMDYGRILIGHRT